ncbi:MAG: thioesterase [Flavobacteriales bacterium CG_4_9_14_3_um_filter_40_17]|nr:MAG: thioesterase [Flavobacteriales bacterium CG_4_9_14_3_um_filter_40_17]
MIKEINLRIRYGETDQMGYAYYGNYPQYLEVARVEWLRSLGFSYKKMEADGIMLPVISLNIQYLKPLTYDENITVKIYLKKTPTVRIEFDYEIFNEQKVLCSKANTQLVFVNMHNGKPVSAPDYLIERIKNETA